MNEEIEQAIKLLQKNGYIVKKWTSAMEKDAKECEEMSESGKDKDCVGCACSMCIAQ